MPELPTIRAYIAIGNAQSLGKTAEASSMTKALQGAVEAANRGGGGDPSRIRVTEVQASLFKKFYGHP